MIKLKISPVVEERLHQAFPKPPRSANLRLSKYVGLLESLVNEAVLRGRNHFELLFKLYSLPVKKLVNYGGQIGPNKKRVHQWLNEQGLGLVDIVVRGSNLTGKVSQVRLSSLVTVEYIEENFARASGGATFTSKYYSQLYACLYPELGPRPSDEEVEELFDTVPVNVASLKAYREWVRTKSKKISKASKEVIFARCNLILEVAEKSGGYFFQRKNPSAFGRMYYHGTSIQSVNKEMRRAILAPCWEYDMRLCVVTWKLGYALEMSRIGIVKDSFERDYSATRSYVESRTDFINTLILCSFKHNSIVSSDDGLRKSIKRAMTAITFGANMRQSGWIDKDGVSRNPALVDIFMNKDERNAFLNDVSVKKFIAEQKAIDAYIVGKALKTVPALSSMPILQTPSGRMSNAKVLAYLFQHAETQAMDIVRRQVKEKGRQVVASIHDAIVVNEKLTGAMLADIHCELHHATGNPYWQLHGEQLMTYEMPIAEEVLAEERAHKERMAKEAAYANEYYAYLAEMNCSQTHAYNEIQLDESE